MNNEMTAITFYEENGEIPSLFLVVETNRDTHHILETEFYIDLISKNYFLEEGYYYDFVYHGEPMSAGPLTEEGVKLYFPQAKHFCQIGYVKIDLDYLMNIEQ